MHADFFALLGQIFDGLFGSFCAGAHHDDDAFGIRGANIVKEVILAADQFGELIHGFLDDGRAVMS